MEWSAHRLFGRIILERYRGGEGVESYLEWTIMPDMKYFKDSAWRHTLLHRTSLHGVDNIGVVIEQGAKFSQYVSWEDCDEHLIKCLIMSHNFLDLFNFIIHPSWPNSLHFRVLWRQVPRMLRLGTLEAPDGLGEVLRGMAGKHFDESDLFSTMVKEYLDSGGFFIDRIRRLYA